MPNAPRTNPTHWIWTVEAPHRFEPDAEAWMRIEPCLSAEQRWQMHQLLAEGMTAERIVALFRIDGHVPPEVVALIGGAIAFLAEQTSVEDAIGGRGT